MSETTFIHNHLERLLELGVFEIKSRNSLNEPEYDFTDVCREFLLTYLHKYGDAAKDHHHYFVMALKQWGANEDEVETLATLLEGRNEVIKELEKK